MLRSPKVLCIELNPTLTANVCTLILSAWLKAVQEAPETALENLDKAEKLGLVASADAWLATRKLRNLMVHEYLQNTEALFEALTAAHRAVPMLADTCQTLIQRSRHLIG